MRHRLWIFPSIFVVMLIIGLSLTSALNTGPTPPDSPRSPPNATPMPPAAAPRPRVAIPRPHQPEVAVLPAPTAPTAETPPEPSTQEPTPDDLPRVFGGNEELNRELQQEMAKAAMPMVECLHDWIDLQPGVFVGRAVFEMEIDQNGLAQLDILDVEQVPEPTLACLGDVLWEEVAWPTADEPTVVEWPVQVSVDRPEE